MELLEAIRTRRSIRKYKPDPIPEDQVREILNAGRWAPSSRMNVQPWKFIVLTDEKLRKEMAGVLSKGRFIMKSSLGIAITVDPKVAIHPLQDAAAATQNMLLAAHALGLGGCWIAPANESEEKSAKEIIGAPEEVRLTAVISLGYPVETPQIGRKELDEITFINKYGSR